ncbi:MAG: hypothetical protein PGN15_00175 [Aeromicrobium erythreum]
MSTPPSSGPAVKERFVAAMPSAFAAGSSSAGSSRGSIAERAGWFTANSADCTATNP